MDKKEAFDTLLAKFNSDECVKPELPCPRCNGTGQTLHWKTKEPEQCFSCDGAQMFQRPDFAAIADTLVITRKGVTGVRKSRGKLQGRTYYVWRLYQFHSGRDVSLPMVAEMDLGDDPYRDYLDLLARALVGRFQSTGSVGGARWRKALYG